jgi:hypothetical protein
VLDKKSFSVGLAESGSSSSSVVVISQKKKKVKRKHAVASQNSIKQ